MLRLIVHFSEPVAAHRSKIGDPLAKHKQRHKEEGMNKNNKHKNYHESQRPTFSSSRVLGLRTWPCPSPPLTGQELELKMHVESRDDWREEDLRAYDGKDADRPDPLVNARQSSGGCRRGVPAKWGGLCCHAFR